MAKTKTELKRDIKYEASMVDALDMVMGSFEVELEDPDFEANSPELAQDVVATMSVLDFYREMYKDFLGTSQKELVKLGEQAL
jgi:hypothetical protein